MGGVQPGTDLVAGNQDENPEPAPCEWCGLSHGKLCPHVKAVEFQYSEDGEKQLVRVEFFAPIDYYPPTPDKSKPEPDDSYPKLTGR